MINNEKWFSDTLDTLNALFVEMEIKADVRYINNIFFVVYCGHKIVYDIDSNINVLKHNLNKIRN